MQAQTEERTISIMKKSFYLLFTLIFCVCLIAGCNGKNQQENTAPANTEEQTTSTNPVSEKDAAAFVSNLYDKYEIYRSREWNIRSPKSIFPQKSENSYVLPYFLDNYFYLAGKEFNIHEDADGILTDGEEDFFDKTYGIPYFSAIKISEVQKAVNEIFGSDKYQISGGIENNCTESGYYVMPGGRGGDAVLALKDYSISNSRINESGASVSVSENWQEVGSDGICRDVSVKTTYIIGYEKGFLYLENVIFD